jgi:hypothetical protein
MCFQNRVTQLFLALLTLGLGAFSHAANDRTQAAYWRFEGGKAGNAVLSAFDESGETEALVKGQPPAVSD